LRDCLGPDRTLALAGHDRLDGGNELGVNLPGAHHVPGLDSVDHLGVGGTEPVPDHADHPAGSVRQPGQVEWIVPGVVGKPTARHDLRPAEEVTLGIFDGHDPVMVACADQSFGVDRGAGAAWNVVEHHRKVCRVGHSDEVR